MTLILTLGNNEQVIQISDRRLSSDGRMVDDESNKCGVLFCGNARMAFGYTGLAKWQSFYTPTWLLKALHDSAAPDYTIGETLERVKVNATKTFQNHPALRRADKKSKRLSVMFSGYINLDGNARQGCAILSNYHDFINNSAFHEADDQFSIHYSSARKEEEWPTLVQRVGNWHALSNDHVEELRELLCLKKPASALIGKAIELIRDMSDDPRSLGSIGKQLMSIIIPKDHMAGIECGYHSNYAKPETYFPALVYLLPNQHRTVDGVNIRPVGDNTPPLSVPKVGKNQPCPCGSKMKYKHCHGKIKKQRKR